MQEEEFHGGDIRDKPYSATHCGRYTVQQINTSSYFIFIFWTFSSKNLVFIGVLFRDFYYCRRLRCCRCCRTFWIKVLQRPGIPSKLKFLCIMWRRSLEVDQTRYSSIAHDQRYSLLNFWGKSSGFRNIFSKLLIMHHFRKKR